MRSLRARLLTTLSAATLLLWCVTGVVSYLKARVEAGELLDGQLAQTAKLIMAQVSHEEYSLRNLDAFTEPLDSRTDNPYEQPLDFQVWDINERLIMRSDDAPPTPMAQQTGYSDFRHGTQTWRLLSVWEPGGRYQVQVAQPTLERERVAFEVASQVAIPIIVALPLLALLIYLAVWGALRPLGALTSGVAARTPENLEPLPDTRAPDEVRPLIHALNALLARLRITLDNERRFTADAAHELRTPLAGLKIHAQVAQASSRPEDHGHALQQMVSGVERTSKLVDQLLRLARLDPLQGLQEIKPVDMNALIPEVEADLADLAEGQNQHIHTAIPEQVVLLYGDKDMLHVALRNLLENALRHTPPGSTVRITLTRGGGEIRLSVTDDGPGVARDELDRLTERFYRGGDVTTEGSGLGLAIVQRIAMLHDAKLEFRNLETRGLSASLVWTSSAK